MPEVRSSLALRAAQRQLSEGRLEQALEICRQVPALSEESADALHLAGIILFRQGDVESAVASVDEALKLRPAAEFAHTLASIYLSRGETEAAIGMFRRAVELDATCADAWNQLGFLLTSSGRAEEAIQCYQRTLESRPDDPLALNNLACLYAQQGCFDRASKLLSTLIHLHGRMPEAVNNLGMMHLGCGRVAEAIECHREAIHVKPSYAEAHSNLLHAMLYSDRHSPEELFEEHLRWARQHTPAPSVRAVEWADRNPVRVIHVGYLSADLHRHPISLFLEPILAHHDRTSFVVTCYHDSVQSDEVTTRLRGLSSVWHETAAMGNEQLASRIRQDRIDILVELAAHSGGNRLPLIAGNPAPIVISYLGYAFTTGLSAVNYRLTDEVLDPPGMTEALHAERLLRLPDTFWCFQPPAQAPPVTALPAQSVGRITFGSANRLAKVSGRTLDWWAQVLRNVEASRFRLIAPGLHEDTVRQRVLGEFAHRGIAPERLELQGALPPAEYLAYVGTFDIALDTYPFTGGATTCQTLWMGVPVVSLTGRSPISRVSASVLAATGLGELVANDDAVAARLAVDLANDLPRLMRLRSELRMRMRASPLTDGPRFVRNLEQAYRRVWGEWCAESAGGREKDA